MLPASHASRGRLTIPFHINTSELELLSKIAGLAGSAVTTVKVFTGYAIDQSLNRRVTKTTDEIDALLGRLAKLEREQATAQTANLAQYKLQVEEDLQSKLRALERIRAQKHGRAIRRNEEPKGIQRWLLVYRPEGFNGLIIQTLYYAFCLVVILGVIIIPIELLWSQNQEGLLGIILGPFVAISYGLIALYLRSISLRQKSVGNAVRLDPSKHPNRDLGWLRRNLLIFKKGDGFSGLRALYYFLLFMALYLPIISWVFRIHAPSTAFQRIFYQSQVGQVGLWVPIVYLLFAEILKSDALSRRARANLASQSATNPQTAAKAVPVV